MVKTIKIKNTKIHEVIIIPLESGYKLSVVYSLLDDADQEFGPRMRVDFDSEGYTTAELNKIIKTLEKVTEKVNQLEKLN